jgi:hypothetical protein
MRIFLARHMGVNHAGARRVLAADRGKALYRKRHATVEPVFGQM